MANLITIACSECGNTLAAFQGHMLGPTPNVLCETCSRRQEPSVSRMILDRLVDLFPSVDYGEDLDGQIIIYTGVYDDWKAVQYPDIPEDN